MAVVGEKQMAVDTLQNLPGVGENSSGPLGPGLLASGLLGTIIRDLQFGLAEPGQSMVCA